MKEEIANVVHPVFQYGLRLKERLGRAEGADLDMLTEQSNLKGLLLSDLEAKRFTDYGGDKTSDHSSAGRSLDGGRRSSADMFLGIRYALVCWLDEIFIADSPWSEEWKEHTLEQSLYSSRERAWWFWEQARKAEARPGGDALEVCYLCVMLGFRGELRHDPDKLQGWIAASQTRIARGQEKEMAGPAETEPPVNVPPRYGQDRFQRMVLWAALLVLVMIPVMAFVLVKALASE
jgi:type VI secretion system protein ImpK